MNGLERQTQYLPMKQNLFPEQDNKDNLSIPPPLFLTTAFSSPHPTSQQRLGRFSGKTPYKIRDFLISGFPNCDASLLPRQYPPVPLCIAPIRLEGKENQCEHKAHDSCCPLSLAQHPRSSGSLTCQSANTVEISDLSQFLTNFNVIHQKTFPNFLVLKMLLNLDFNQ